MYKSNSTAFYLLIISLFCFFLFILKHSGIALFITFASLLGVFLFSHINGNLYMKNTLYYGLLIYIFCLIGTMICFSVKKWLGL